MSLEQRTIVHENALVFVQEIEKAIEEGLRITDTNAGAPYLNTYMKEVIMVPAADAVAGPEDRMGYEVQEDGNVTVVGYEGILFLLTLQRVILAGYTVTNVDFVAHGAKTAILAPKAPSKVTPAVVQEAPVATEAQPTKPTRRSGKAK